VARRAGCPATFRPFNAYDLRSVLATGTALAARSQPTHLSVRLVAESLDTHGRDGLWRLCAMLGARGGSTFLATLGEGSPPPAGSAPGEVLKPLPAAVVAAEIKRFGGTMNGPVRGEAGMDWWTISWQQRSADLT
jgi:hypothetical protein